MRRERLGACIAAMAALLLTSPLPAADEAPRQQIESRLMCYCGCSDLTVRVCTCGTAEGMRQEIAERLAGGATPGQVVEAFVSRYGERILSAPRKEGFDLLAWVAPFAALLLAGTMLVVVIRRWRAAAAPAARPERPAESGAAGPRPPAPPSREDREALGRVEREIRERF